MRIGTTMGGYDRFGEQKYLKIRAHGFSAVDFNLNNTDSPFYTLTLQEALLILEKEKQLAQEAGIEIWQAHGPWRWPPQDATAAQRQERMEKMQRSIVMTAALGCKNWVVHPIMPFGEEDRDTDDAPRTWELNYTFFSQLLKTAKAHDIVICFENMPAPKLSLSTPSDILQFVRTINDDHFKICLDTGHAAIAADEPVEDCIRKLGAHIQVLHVHDCYGGMDLHLLPYQGIINWPGVGAALKEIGFNGVFSLETGAPQRLPDPLFEDMTISIANIAKEIIK